MTYWGKIIGAMLGFLLTWGNPLGAILGLLVGNLFDRGLRVSAQSQHWRAQTDSQHRIQQAFFRATFLVMGHVAKSDGHVTKDEIREAEAVMQRMQLTRMQRQEAIVFFRTGKQFTFSLQQTLAELLRQVKQRSLLRMFIDIQFQAAMAEGYISPPKQQILNKICQTLGFAAVYSQYYHHYREEEPRYREYSRHHEPPPRHDSLTELQRSYALLEISEDADKKTIKRAYRKLMSQNHPDKLIAQGLPEEMIKLATDKTQKIQSAYEAIRQSRGF